MFSVGLRARRLGSLPEVPVICSSERSSRISVPKDSCDC